MSSLRKRYRIVVDGQPHDIVTNAHDLAAVSNIENLSPMTAGFATLHAACMRLDVPGVPHDYDKFLDLLDDMEELEGGVPSGGPVGDDTDPTTPPASDG